MTESAIYIIRAAREGVTRFGGERHEGQVIAWATDREWADETRRDLAWMGIATTAPEVQG